MAVCFSPLPPLTSTQTIVRASHCTTDKRVSLNIRTARCYLNNNYGCIGGDHVKRLKYMNSNYCANTEVAEAEDYSSISTISMTPIEQLKLFYAFSRPYACIGTILNVVSTSLIAIENLSDISLLSLIGLLKAAAAFGCISIYVGGVNQLFDVEIDRINKPDLPIASGKMKIKTAISITSSFAIMAFAIGISTGSLPLLWGIFLSFLLFSAYSVELPFLRWKNSVIGATASMIGGIGIILPVSTYLHMQTFIFGREANFPKTLAFGTIILSVLFAIVTFIKDIPDIEGDKKFGIRSLATRICPKKVFWISIYLIEMAYTFAIVVGATSSYTWSKLIIIASHVVLSLTLWKRAKSIDFEDKNEMQSFYMFIWKLIYAEFMLIPLVR